jgi:hypothetical protein
MGAAPGSLPVQAKSRSRFGPMKAGCQIQVAANRAEVFRVE